MTRTKLHEDEHFIHSVGHPVPCSIDEMDDVGVAFEQSLIERSKGIQRGAEDATHHDIYLLLYISEHCIVCNCNALEYMVCSPIHWRRGPHEVDMSKAP